MINLTEQTTELLVIVYKYVGIIEFILSKDMMNTPMFIYYIISSIFSMFYLFMFEFTFFFVYTHQVQMIIWINLELNFYQKHNAFHSLKLHKYMK